MNRIFLIFSVLFSLTFINGCKDKDDKGPESLDLKTTSLVFNEQAGEGYVNLYSNTTWRTSWNETWLSCTPASGEGNFIVTVSTTPNSNPDVRTGTITLTTDGGITKTIEVTQGGLEAFVIITPGTADVDPLGKDITVEVAASYPWSVQVPDEVKDWIQVKEKTESQAVFTVDPNRTGEDRSAGIIFQLNEYNEKQAILSLSQLLLPEPEDVVFPAAGTMGDDITLTGTNLNLIDEVWFGDSKATIADGRTSESMTVTIPIKDEEGPVDLRIVFHGIYDSVLGSCTLSFPIAPEVEAFPGNGIIGLSITLTGQNFDLVDEILFGSEKGTIAAGRTNESMDVIIPATAAEGDVEIKIIYLSSKEVNVGTINLSIVAPEVTIPAKGFIGDNTTLTGNYFELIDKVYFGDVQGTIASGRTGTSMTVTIPGTAVAGEADLKVTYLGDKEKNVGKINLKQSLALYAGSKIAGTPALTWGAQNTNRMAFCAFDGIYTEDDYKAFEGKYADTYGRELDGTPPNWANSFWQTSSGSKVGEVAPVGVGQVWVKLNYSATTGYGNADGYVTFDRMTIMNRQTNPNPQTYTIEVSDDDATWTKLVSANDAQKGTLASNARVTHEFATPVTAKYVRFVVITSTTNDGSNTGSGGNVATRQIMIYSTQ
ncbi:MAG: discoidin domain-containing protein [Bacteroidales bacterium]|jgi:hypothetical protein|nr:discoidin domain-containing protein [Bacteroidales bacterium]